MRTMTAATIAGLLAHTSPGAVVFLLKIEHASMTTLYLTNNTVDLTYSGQLYTATGFEPTLAPETEDNNSAGEIVFCGVDQSVMTLIRGLSFPRPTLTMMAAYWTETGTFDAFETQVLEIESVSGGAGTLVASLTISDCLKCEIGTIEFTANSFPGLF